MYLTEEQYLQVEYFVVNLHIVDFFSILNVIFVQTTIPSWMRSRQEGWYGLCRWWASPEFKAIFVRNRRCRGNQIVHTYGADGHIRMAKRMVSRLV